MEKFNTWLQEHIVPGAKKIAENPWIGAISSAFTIILPFIMVSSLISLYGVIIGYLPFEMPSLSSIGNFAMGLTALQVAFLVPYLLMEKKGKGKYAVVAGLLGIGSFLQVLNYPTIDGYYAVTFGDLGAGGTFVSLVVGLFTAMVFNWYIGLKFLEDSEMPDFIVEWINGTVPVLIVLAVGFILNSCNVSIPAILTKILEPVFTFGQSYLGMLVIVFVPAFLYSFGIGTRTTSAFRNPIYYAGIAANVELVAQGLKATNIVTFETIHTCALTCLGGTGGTLMLVIMMCFSKSKRLKTIGRVTIVPSIFNINEPVIYGAPVIFNPLLMIPMWINAILTATIVYFTMSTGFLNTPSYVFQAWALPAPIGAILATNDWKAIIVWAIVCVVTFCVWYPFFKAYEKTLLEEENAQIESK